MREKILTVIVCYYFNIVKVKYEYKINILNIVAYEKNN